MGNSCTSVFPNTSAWQQQEWNKTKRQTKNVRREAWVWKDVKRRHKKSRRPITTWSKYIINNHNVVLFYKIWKTYNEIQSTTNKMDLNNRKITNHPPSPVQRVENNNNIIIIILSFDLNDHLVSRKRQVPYSMAKVNGRTHARVFSQTFAHGNNNNEISQRNRGIR